MIGIFINKFIKSYKMKEDVYKEVCRMNQDHINVDQFEEMIINL